MEEFKMQEEERVLKSIMTREEGYRSALQKAMEIFTETFDVDPTKFIAKFFDKINIYKKISQEFWDGAYEDLHKLWNENYKKKTGGKNDDDERA